MTTGAETGFDYSARAARQVFVPRSPPASVVCFPVMVSRESFPQNQFVLRSPLERLRSVWKVMSLSVKIPVFDLLIAGTQIDLAGDRFAFVAFDGESDLRAAARPPPLKPPPPRDRSHRGVGASSETPFPDSFDVAETGGQSTRSSVPRPSRWRPFCP